MVLGAIRSVLGMDVPRELVKQRESKNGTYWTVDVGPLEVQSPEQIVDIYAKIKEDKRTKFMM